MLLDKVDPEGVSAVIMSLVQCCSYYEHTLVGILQRGCLFCYSAVATRQCYSQQHCDEPHFTFPSVCLHNTGIFCNNFDYSSYCLASISMLILSITSSSSSYLDMMNIATINRIAGMTATSHRIPCSVRGD